MISEDEITFLTGGDDQNDDNVVLKKLYHPNLKLLIVNEGPKGCRYYTKSMEAYKKELEAMEAYKKELEEYNNSIAAATDDNQQPQKELVEEEEHTTNNTIAGAKDAKPKKNKSKCVKDC